MTADSSANSASGDWANGLVPSSAASTLSRHVELRTHTVAVASNVTRARWSVRVAHHVSTYSFHKGAAAVTAAGLCVVVVVVVAVVVGTGDTGGTGGTGAGGGASGAATDGAGIGATAAAGTLNLGRLAVGACVCIVEPPRIGGVGRVTAMSCLLAAHCITLSCHVSRLTLYRVGATGEGKHAFMPRRRTVPAGLTNSRDAMYSFLSHQDWAAACISFGRS